MEDQLIVYKVRSFCFNEETNVNLFAKMEGTIDTLYLKEQTDRQKILSWLVRVHRKHFFLCF